VPAGFHDASALENENLVGMDNRRKTMGNENRDEIFPHRYLTDRFRYFFLRERIQRRRCLIEYQEIRPAEQRPCDGKALLLPAGNFYSAFSNNCIESLVGTSKQTLTRGFIQHSHTVFVARLRIHKEKVLANASRE